MNVTAPFTARLRVAGWAYRTRPTYWDVLAATAIAISTVLITRTESTSSGKNRHSSADDRTDGLQVGGYDNENACWTARNMRGDRLDHRLGIRVASAGCRRDANEGAGGG